jgi:hypothetical protein
MHRADTINLRVGKDTKVRQKERKKRKNKEDSGSFKEVLLNSVT